MIVTVEANELEPGDIEDGLVVGRVWEKGHHVLVMYSTGRYRLKYKHVRVTVKRGYDDENRCHECKAHIAEPHSPECTRS
ncbi:hypothetical protein FHT44_005068 [Mycolicibacterium sp. BK634]|uniref:hypothetical protein n=1 Tax=Mycolicibacterium sp. BK634 TaxID=2587099 RepID=UPI00161A37AC|nr:hypothetical protein [Mycolicibacterium sp. BK634]MBB3752556.1 hypothetical protein [Mycolicibacterium sp. BK634]